MQGGLDAPVVHVAECCDFVLRSHDLLLIDVHGRCSFAPPLRISSRAPRLSRVPAISPDHRGCRS